MTVVTSASQIHPMFSDRLRHKWSLDQLSRQHTSGNNQIFQSVPENATKDNTEEEEAILGNTGLDLSRLRAEEQYYFGEASEEDIVWVPSRARYLQRQLAKCRRPSLHPKIAPPRGFPAEISGPEVWTGDEMQENPERWIVNLKPEDIREIESAVRGVIESGIELKNISKENFKLPNLGPLLIRLGESLYDNGPGVFLLRGLNPSAYTSLENVIANVGIASYVAEERGVQDERGNMILHLKDIRNTNAGEDVRQAPYSNVEQPYHTDAGEIISLYTLSPAVKGGRSKLASFGKVYNHIASIRPELIHVLASKTFVFDRFNEELPEPRAVFFPPNEINKVPTMQMARRPLTGSKVSPRSKHLPRLTNAQIDALDTLHFTAEANALYIELQKGDMMFWNNYKVLHGREGFQDPETTTADGPSGRHLIRLWLRRAGGGIGGGAKEILDELNVYGPREHEVWPVEPITDYKHITTRLRSCGYA